MIASHYAEPVDRVIGLVTELRSAPSNNAPVTRQLEPGEPFALLDESLGWAWGYAGAERRVGYIPSEAFTHN